MDGQRVASYLLRGYRDRAILSAAFLFSSPSTAEVIRTGGVSCARATPISSSPGAPRVPTPSKRLVAGPGGRSTLRRRRLYPSANHPAHICVILCVTAVATYAQTPPPRRQADAPCDGPKESTGNIIHDHPYALYVKRIKRRRR